MTHDPLRILVVDDDQSMAKTLVDILRVKGHKAEMAHSGEEALDRLEEQPFACVLSDIKMPGINGVELHRAIKTLQPDLPVVLMTAYSADSLVREGLEEGALAALTKPLNLDTLLGFLSYLRQEQPVVIVDDDLAFCRTLSGLLRRRGLIATCICDPSAALDQIEMDRGVLLLDMKLDGTNGLVVLRRIRERHPRLVVILITGYRQEMDASIEAALELGAYTCLYKPLQIDELLHSLAKVRRQELSSILTPEGSRDPRSPG
jgi:DNA-binding NtrC family response regulator